MARTGIIYKLTNTANGKVYIGQTIKTLERRWKQHLKDSFGGMSSRYLCRAIRKYGADAFERVVLHADVRLVSLNRLEREAIAEYSSANPKFGYNRTLGGDGNVMSPVARLQHALRMVGRFAGKKNPFYGRKHSEETKRIISDAHRGVPVPQSVISRRQRTVRLNGSNLGQRHHMFGKKWDARHLKIFRDKSSGKNNPMYGKSGALSPNFGKHASEETRRKQSLARTQYWQKLFPERRTRQARKTVRGRIKLSSPPYFMPHEIPTHSFYGCLQEY